VSRRRARGDPGTLRVAARGVAHDRVLPPHPATGGNVLTPRIQGQAVRVHPIVIVFAVTPGASCSG
jgi:hypothetical protein